MHVAPCDGARTSIMTSASDGVQDARWTACRGGLLEVDVGGRPARAPLHVPLDLWGADRRAGCRDLLLHPA